MLYSEDLLAEAEEKLLKLYSSLRGLSPPADIVPPDGCEQHSRFLAAMANDFDTVNAVAAMAELSRELLQLQQASEGEGSGAEAARISFEEKARHLYTMGGVLGLLQRDPEVVCKGPVDSDFEEKVEQLIQERDAARKDKDFARADAIRDELTDLGVILEDGGKGTTWRVASMA
mmetsp:Transcript_28846/g.40593  ORF Transcript_28846/g.40593 Transcript_28846/m.40593 type:complete len:174 (-) Transcript_28846:12-533(-)